MTIEFPCYMHKVFSETRIILTTWSILLSLKISKYGPSKNLCS